MKQWQDTNDCSWLDLPTLWTHGMEEAPSPWRPLPDSDAGTAATRSVATVTEPEEAGREVTWHYNMHERSTHRSHGMAASLKLDMATASHTVYGEKYFHVMSKYILLLFILQKLKVSLKLDTATGSKWEMGQHGHYNNLDFIYLLFCLS